MPRVYGGSPGKPRSRSGSQFGRSAFVYSLRIGYPEMVVNSAWRSGLFSSAGWSVFFSQACSLAEGARSSEDVSAGGAACVVPLARSLILIAPGEEFNCLFERRQRLMLFERYPRGKGSLAAPQTREHQWTIQTRKYGNEKAGRGFAPGRALPARFAGVTWRVFLGGQFFVAYRLSVFHGSIGCFAVVGPPEVKDNAVRLSCSLRDLLGLLRRPIKNGTIRPRFQREKKPGRNAILRSSLGEKRCVISGRSWRRGSPFQPLDRARCRE